MKKILYKSFFIVCAIFVFCSIAFAQYESDKSRIGLKVGLYKPKAGRLSDLSSTWITPVVDYYFRYDEDENPTTILSLTWTDEGNSLNKGKFSAITLTQIKRFGKTKKGQFFAGGGAGVYMLKYQAIEDVTEGEFTFKRLISGSETNLGLHLLAGYEFGKNWFVEIRYDIAGDVSRSKGPDVNFDGLFFTAGTRMLY